MTIFLGGTCANNNWREGFTEALTSRQIPASDIFNPVLPAGVEWTSEDAVKESAAKRLADIVVFYIADPKQDGNTFSAYSTCEAIMALYDDPQRAVVIFDDTGMSGHPIKAMTQIRRDLIARFPEQQIHSSPLDAVDYITKLFYC